MTLFRAHQILYELRLPQRVTMALHGTYPSPTLAVYGPNQLIFPNGLADGGLLGQTLLSPIWFADASEIQFMQWALKFLTSAVPAIDVSQIEYGGMKIYLNKETSAVVMRMAGLQSHWQSEGEYTDGVKAK